MAINWEYLKKLCQNKNHIKWNDMRGWQWMVGQGWEGKYYQPIRRY